MNMRIVSLLLAGLVLAASAQAAVITDPIVGSGDTAINPDNESIDNRNTAATSYAAEATLTAKPEFRTLQGLSGTATATNYFVFTDANLPDMRFVQTAGNAMGTDQSSDNGTSPTNGSYAFQTSGGSAVLTITFGTYDVGASTFTANRTVDATCLTLNNFKAKTAAPAVSAVVTVEFYDAAGSLIGSQSITSTNGLNDQTAYFGTDLDGIGSMKITLSTPNSSRAWIDDVGFTVVPEPATMSLLALGGVLALRRRRA